MGGRSHSKVAKSCNVISAKKIHDHNLKRQNFNYNCEELGEKNVILTEK